MKWKKFKIDILDSDDDELSAIVKYTKPSHFQIANGFVFLPEPYFDKLKCYPRSVLHKSFLFLSPEYRSKNGYPHEIEQITDEMRNKYDSR